MDAYVQLALVEKVRRVFTQPGLLLSFPLLAPLTFKPAQLASLSTPQTVEDYATGADFARIVNFLATDAVATATDRLLWDVYRDVLERAVVAGPEVGDDQGRAADEAANRLLFETADDGTRTESESYRRYRQCQDAWFVAQQEYAAQRLTAELTQDPQVRQRWTSVAEPMLRAALDVATEAWETVGRRSAIEAAILAERTATANDPRHRWAEWAQAFDPEIQLLTDSVGGRYAPTGLSPRDVVDQPWLTFELSADEMAALVDEAPAELKGVLDDGHGTDVEQVSFAYRSAALVRPWFRPEVLTSGIWSSTEPDLQLSDGLDPPTGACPAYPAACILVRDVRVVTKGDRCPTALPVLQLTTEPRLGRDAEIDVRRRSVHWTSEMSRLAAGVGVPQTVPLAYRTLDRTVFTQLADPEAVGGARRLGPLRRRPDRNAAVVPRPDRSGRPAPVPPPDAGGPTDDTISILAFICRCLPRAPDLTGQHLTGQPGDQPPPA